jgi:outer membrane biosynthesis protein TonB
MASRASHSLKLALFVGLALFASYLLWQTENTEERIVRVEQRQANTCLAGQPRVCRELLNRLLTHGTSRQRRQIKRALKQREQMIRPADVQPPPKKHPPPQPSVPPTPEPEPAPPPEPPPAQTTTEPPAPEPLPEQDPALPPTSTVPTPPTVCDEIPPLPVCPEVTPPP